MRRVLFVPLITVMLALTGLSASMTQAAAAKVVAKVNLSSQRMHVYVDGKKRYSWAVSTGKRGWETPAGAYRPIRTYKSYYEKKWNMSLPYLVLISHDGIGIHATSATGRLGRTASHGCIRLHPSNAKKFFGLVTSNRHSTSVQVVR